MIEWRDHVETAAAWLREAERVVVFTGAGISAESGIATFRDADGFWQKFPPEQFATWNGILNLSARDPVTLADFLLELLTPIAQAQPNPGHLALAALEQFRRVTLITQNVDALHQQAGSRNVKEVHGTLFQIVGASGTVMKTISRAELQQVVDAIQAAKAVMFKRTKLAVAVRPM